MVAVDPRAAVTRPCAGRALPWNASFMTIPFKAGIFAEAPFGPSCSSNRPPSAFGPGVSPLKARSQRCMSLVCGGFRSGRHAGGRLWSFHSGRKLLAAGGYPPGTLRADIRLSTGCRTANRLPA
jgi:hypothetical protein